MIGDGELKYKIGELAELANVSKRTIDYYTKLGLLKPERSECNYRYYSPEALQKLKLIEAMKKEKLTLEEIRQRFELMEKSEPEIQDVLQKVQQLEKKMKQLEEEVLKLKPALAKLNGNESKALRQQLSTRCASFVQTLLILFGEQPPLL
ncbi:MerR family transcriptional regulator [Bacillaceae bacterium]